MATEIIAIDTVNVKFDIIRRKDGLFLAFCSSFYWPGMTTDPDAPPHLTVHGQSHFFFMSFHCRLSLRGGGVERSGLMSFMIVFCLFCFFVCFFCLFVFRSIKFVWNFVNDWDNSKISRDNWRKIISQSSKKSAAIQVVKFNHLQSSFFFRIDSK